MTFGNGGVQFQRFLCMNTHEGESLVGWQRSQDCHHEEIDSVLAVGQREFQIECDGLLKGLIFILTVSLALHGLVLATLMYGYTGAFLWGELVSEKTSIFASRIASVALTDVVPKAAQLLYTLKAML